MALQGKVALVIGGGRGIGAATTRLLATRGTNVVINYRQNAAAANELMTAIRTDGGNALTVQADVRDPQQRAALIQETLCAYERIDILVHSVPSSAVLKPFAHMNWDEFILGVDNELKAAFEVTKAVLPTMQQQHYGRIAYVGSGLSKSPSLPGSISVGVAKAGLHAFAKYIAKEYGPDGITANVVAPGMVETDLTTHLPPEQKQRIVTQTPLQRIAQPEDIARVIAFFADDDSGFMTGTYAPVNGGLTME